VGERGGDIGGAGTPAISHPWEIATPKNFAVAILAPRNCLRPRTTNVASPLRHAARGLAAGEGVAGGGGDSEFCWAFATGFREASTFRRRRLIGDRDLSRTKKLDHRRLIGDRDLSPRKNLDRRRLIGDRDLSSRKNLDRRRLIADRDLSPIKNRGRRRLIADRDLSSRKNRGRRRLIGDCDLSSTKNLDRRRLIADRDSSPRKNRDPDVPCSTKQNNACGVWGFYE
jgi:hypothetical protein